MWNPGQPKFAQEGKPVVPGLGVMEEKAAIDSSPFPMISTAVLAAAFWLPL